MRDFLLDTNIIRYWYDTECAQHQAILGNISAVRARTSELDTQPKLLISVVTLGEIEFGHRVQVGDRAEDNGARIRFVREQLPAPFELTQDAAEMYAELRMRLFNRFAPGEMRKPKMRPEQLIDPVTALSLQIQENDLWICAQAAAHGLVLVTNDKMAQIAEVGVGMNPPLITENWVFTRAP